MMALMKTSASESASASCSQNGVRRTKGSQMTMHREEEEEGEGHQGAVVEGADLQVVVALGVVVGVGAEVAADLKCLLMN